MIKKNWIRNFTGLSIFLFSGLAGSSQMLSLQDAIQIALKNSLDIQVLKNNLEISGINNHIGVAGGLPTVTGSISDIEQLTNINQKLNTGAIITRNGAAGNNMNSSINAGILLYNGSRVIATKKRLEEIQTQSEQYLNAQVQDVAAAVMTAYFDVVRQQNYMKTLDRSIEASQKRLDIVKTQQSVGMANNADLFQSQLDLNTLFQSKQSQELVIDQSITGLLVLLNLKPDSVVIIKDTILVDRSVVLGDVLNGLGNNADIAAADQQIKINQLISRETAAQRYPSIRANAAYSYNRSQSSGGQLLLNQNNGPSLGINIGIPIYNGNIYKRQERVAQINTKNAELQRDILMRTYYGDVVKTYQAYTSGLNQVDTQQQNVVLAQKLLDLVMYRFQLRQATIVEVKQAQQSFEEASFSLTNLAFAAKASEIELKRLANQIKF